ncbi:MAG: cation:dicarboxylase symporter family transporter [Bdellovibrio sp.]|nr:cation:dicarboxylase symporter family transporter [Bdellovibrio sp.]
MRKLLRRITLSHWIFVGLVIGFLIGYFAPEWAPHLKPFRTLFLNGVKCIIAPLIFATIVTGIASAGSFKQLGVMGVRALVYFEVVTTLALFFGLLAVNLLKPGAGLNVIAGSGEGISQVPKTQVGFGSFIEHLLPTNVAEAVVHGDVLQIVIVSTIFAFAVLAVGAKAKPVLNLCESLAEVMFRFTGYIMLLAPLGVGAALATSMAEHGWQVIFPMLKMVGTLYLALVVFVMAVFLPILKIFKIPVRSFFAHVNLDGSTLYLAVASVFVAQASGIDLPIGTQLAMMASLMLTTKGVAAVPRASIVVLSGTLTAFGIPLEGIALIMAGDNFMDMARTGVNLLGNCLATAVIARCEDITLG